MSRAAARVALAILLSAFVAGCVPWELRQVLDGPKGKALSISPSATVLPGGGTLTFAADGGVPPYAYAMASGLGSVDPVTGFFTASASPGPAVVRVTDKTGKSQEATITVQTSGPLSISPSTVSVVAGGTLTFLPIGGSGSYSFTMQISGSGSPSVTSGGGVYTAGSNPATTDVVRLTDTVTLAFVDATVTVTAVASTVNYTVSSVAALPSTGTVSSAVPAGTFTLQNAGTGNGQQTVTWELYLSADATLGGGDWLVGSGTTGALNATISQPVPISGTFPAVAPGPWNLIVHVSAADDTTPGNNTSAAHATSLSAQNIDYSVPAPGPSSVVGTVAGQSVSGDFTIDNIGAADGVAGIEWAVYASADTVLDGADYLVARGGRAAIAAAAAPPTIPFSGYWPSTPGTWYLLATVSATDDVSAANNTTASGSTFTTTGPAPLAINYSVGAGPSSTGGTVAGDPLTGSFRIQNTLAATGTQPVSWTAYLSSDTNLDIGTDPVLDSGSSAPVPGSTLDPAITFGGTWPSVPGSWYLIVAISSSEDTVPGNNVTSSAAFVTTTAPVVNYTVTSVVNAGGTTAGAALSGNLTIQNIGAHAGTQFVPWSVYLSSDASLNIGTDQLIATGSLPSPGLGPGASSAAQPFVGTWPVSASSNNYYFIAVVGAGDDVAPGNNVVPSGTFTTVTPPDVNYTVTSVFGVVGTTAGGAFTAQFNAQNVGTAAGTAGVNWTAYISSDNVLDVTDTAFQTNSFGALGAGAPAGPFGLAGTWPAGAATRYIIVKVTASDDVSNGNDSAFTSVPVTIPVYTITSVPNPGPGTAGQAVGGSFTIQNTSTANGSAIINWTAYASLGNNTWDAGDTVIESNTTGALASGASISPGYAGVWPNVAGSYWVIVRATAADASGTATGATGASAAVSVPNVNYDVPNVTVAAVPRIPGQPVNGTFLYHNGGTHPGTISQTVSWDVYASLNGTIDGSDTWIASGTGLAALGAGATSGAIPWAGNWPIVYGDYFILVRVSSSEDVSTLNNTGSSPLQTNVGVYNAESAEPNDDYTNLTNPMPLGITLRPGMAVKITGSMSNADRDDIFRYNTGTATRVIVTVAWSIPTEPSVRIWFMTGPPGVFAKGVSGLTGSMSLDWLPDLPGTDRFIDLDDYWTGTDYTPPPNPTALTYTAWIVAQ